MHLALKNLFQFDERQVLIAGVAKLIFDFCYVGHFGLNSPLKFNSPPMGLNIFWETLKGPTKGTLQIRTYIP